MATMQSTQIYVILVRICIGVICAGIKIAVISEWLRGFIIGLVI